MKYLLLLFISLNVFAGAWLPTADVCSGADGLTSHRTKKKCEEQYPDGCINARGKDLSICMVRPAAWLKEQDESCKGNTLEECQVKLTLLNCASEGYEPVMVYEEAQKEVYCTKHRKEKIVIDDVKKAARDAERATKAQERADRKAEIQELRDHIQDVNSSDLPGWHKKILRRLIRELKD